ncbi:AAA family ATPase [Sphingobacterium oryzagri]|uniref:AAA family ATPase n=1 Tax=Sphingobacterium oryzagri TaxID=3025669 RepID=A0ABY7WFC3_9SPHI|nr:AAA family ATPase [Sphingobacterium sp. KACC 22765]WDF67605.1 AAA family ATPase [Sphingobacterium sp. KACC 22765]
MSKLKISDFGPIKGGYQEDDGWFDVKKVTVFIGNQGSGKSTVAKLYSTMCWIEKALVRGDIREKDILRKGQFITYCSYQNIDDYFKPETVVEYRGRAFHLSYKNEEITILKNEQNGYSFPKIMYVPAERNFISAVRNVKNLKGLASTLYTFSDEFIRAVEDLRAPLDLPINNVKFEYQKLNQLSSIVGDDYKIKLSTASSGFQSFVPLYIVSKYLAETLKNKNSHAVRELSIEEENRIKNEIEQILSNQNLSDEVKQASLAYLSSRFSYSSFINIVEEPEQNLFPSSQRSILNSLLGFNNIAENNQLVLTTHSPYLINYLTLAVKAGAIKENLADDAISKLAEVVPSGSTIFADDLVVYELNELNGTMTKLETYKGLPSDENKLNDELGESNELYARLLEIQKRV